MYPFINFIIFLYNNLRLFYYKWIKRACPHFCFLCAHKGWCIQDIGILNLVDEFRKEIKK